jgi:hypothetical protein
LLWHVVQVVQVMALLHLLVLAAVQQEQPAAYLSAALLLLLPLLLCQPLIVQLAVGLLDGPVLQLCWQQEPGLPPVVQSQLSLFEQHLGPVAAAAAAGVALEEAPTALVVAALQVAALQ